ncbi:hypothetical protein Pmani_008461 [Petrolisthes manimaculis]|uniref:CUB domain-containing protein n=1 Tax=Petrolisthes manimaculis TaxID=1843537 RepID=A0AAE1Q698_9EUCA|nr:hypothetical protein Pmani_008461 [Petrolisthes manimaculis]
MLDCWASATLCWTVPGAGEIHRDNVRPASVSAASSPGFPATFNQATTCTHTLTFTSDVCQIRMDVEVIELSPPTIHGRCNDDSLTFSTGYKWSSVCGTTVDTHFYHDVDTAQSSSLTFTFTTGSKSFDRRWRFRLSQICCDQLSMAPTGCGQYFTTPKGLIKGWNHDGLYLSGQNYAICVRKERNTCSTTYKDKRQFAFKPICDDTFEYPYPVFNDAPSSTTCHTPFTFLNPMPLTVPLQGPHYFYLVTTTDTTNDHTTATNLFYTYTQNTC